MIHTFSLSSSHTKITLERLERIVLGVAIAGLLGLWLLGGSSNAPTAIDDPISFRSLSVTDTSN